MFQAKLNYLIAGFALVFLLLAGQYFRLQIIQHDQHVAQSERIRTNIELLPAQRAPIVLADGTVVADTESVWDVYVDFRHFAHPRDAEYRAYRSPHQYDAQSAVALSKQAKAIEDAELPSPRSRRRFFMYWALRNDPAARHDYELCVERLCLITGVKRNVYDQKADQVFREVNALASALDDIETTKAADVSRAWLRGAPAMSDPDYWERVRRFPKSIHFAPILRTRLQYRHDIVEALTAMIEASDDNADVLRDLCFQAAQQFRDKRDNIDLTALPVAATRTQAQDLLIEQHAFYTRLAEICDRGVREGVETITQEIARMTDDEGEIANLTQRLARLDKELARFKDDYNERWQHYDVSENPLLLMRNAPRQVVELLKVNADQLPGVRCVRRAFRHYHYPRELVHVLGSVGMPDPARLEGVLARESFGQGLEPFIERWFDNDRNAFVNRFDNQVAHQMVGVSGLEAYWDERLSGLYGARVSIRDAHGRIRALEYEQAPTYRDPLTLTIDLELQRDILRTIEKYEPILASKAVSKIARRHSIGRASTNRWRDYKWSFRGSVVVLDVKTGDVLGMVSYPDYNPELLRGTDNVSRAYQRAWASEQRVENRKGYPWWNKRSRQYNRSTTGLYAPGSTFKILTAIALLESGVVTEQETFDEISNIIMVGKTKLRTGHPAGPNIDLRRAIERSSNGYFYTFSQRLGATPSDAWDNLRWWAEEFGFGEHYSTDIRGRRRANLPESDRIWAPNLAMMSIGQGQVTTSPLEIARFYAAVANRGHLIAPHLSREAPADSHTVEVSDATWDAIHDGMRRVVTSPHGTAHDHAELLNRIRAAGKTGTAENGKGTPDHAWFAGFAPYEDPQVAFVVLAQNSDLYGADVAPIVGEVVERYLKRTGVLKSDARVQND